MNYLKNNKGYALYITLAVIILFTVLGMTMLALTSNGMKKNNLRKESVQATALAEKGVDRITKEINTELTNYLGTLGQSRSDFIIELEKVLNKYKCNSGQQKVNDKNGYTGDYSVCIEKYSDSWNEKNKEFNKLRKTVTFRSFGFAGSTENKLFPEIEIGAAHVPEVLKYAVGTNDNKNDRTEPGEGNLLMHGGVSITGDLKIDGNILSFEDGYIGGSWKESLLPEISSYDPKRSPNIVLGKKAYKLIKTSRLDYKIHKQDASFQNNAYYVETPLSSLFRKDKSPTQISRKTFNNPIGINSYKDIYKFDKNAGQQINLGESMMFNNTLDKYKSSSVFPYYNYSKKECVLIVFCKDGNYSSDTGKFILSGTNKFDKFSTLGSLSIHPLSNTKVTSGLYVEGDLFIGDERVNANKSKYEDVTLDGIIFVNGNVKIRGANLKSNVVLYTNGEVDIQYSTINGKTLNDNKTGTLIVFAKESIVIKNISANERIPSNIKGFFYSENEFEMYGVISNIRLEGGISARSVVLNSVRSYIDPWGKYIQDSTHKNSYSRLQIIYDPEIIDRYSDLQKEPIVTEIDEPLVKERK